MRSLSLDQLARFAAKAKLQKNIVIKTARETVERFFETRKILPNKCFRTNYPGVREIMCPIL